jgi:hypothetical protein
VAQRIDEQGKGGGGLAAAGVIEAVARPGRAPVVERLGEPAFGDAGRNDIPRNKGEAEAGDRGFERRKTPLKTSWALHPYFQLPAALGELPGVEAAVGRKTQVDAIVAD